MEHPWPKKKQKKAQAKNLNEYKQMSSQKRKRNSSLRGDSTRRWRLVQIARQRNDSVQTQEKERKRNNWILWYGWWQMY